MAGDPKKLEPHKWKPGQSGNPAGSSAKSRRRKRIREAMALICEQRVPDVFIERLDLRIQEILPEDITFAEVIALRVTIMATLGDEERVLQATKLLNDMIEGVAEGPDPNTQPRVPKLPTTEEQRQAMLDWISGKDRGEPVH